MEFDLWRSWIRTRKIQTVISIDKEEILKECMKQGYRELRMPEETEPEKVRKRNQFCGRITRHEPKCRELAFISAKTTC